ncbi:MAG TPA: hypothetical protein VIZ18_05365, partial [Ktedonobacteraceae bacterium]
MGCPQAARAAKNLGLRKHEASLRTTTPLAALAKGGLMFVHQLGEFYQVTQSSGYSYPNILFTISPLFYFSF